MDASHTLRRTVFRGAHGGTKLFAHLLLSSGMRDGIGQDVAASDILETAS
jgi:hypothetical protein